MKHSPHLKLTLLLLLLLPLAAMAQTWDIGANAMPGGTSTSAVKATLSDGTLTISGTGAQ